ncbi:MAG TPA: iron-sulfur cluster assembly accessory protein [Chthoniobacterales bacterium]
MITITDNAVSHLQSLLKDRGVADSQGLRIGISKGGCAGLQYDMLLDSASASDTIIEKGDVRVLIDEASVSFLKGSTIDYCDDLAGTGFRIQNPNATRSCGCGTSFEPSSETAVTPQ